MTNRDQAGATSEGATQQLLAQLLDRYGPVIGGPDLRRVLGFPSAAALRQAALRGTLPVPVFVLPNRKGRFALTSEVSSWLQERRGTATLPSSEGHRPAVAAESALGAGKQAINRES